MNTKTRSLRRGPAVGLGLLLVSALGACDTTQDPLGVQDAPIVVLGRVADVAAPAAMPAAHSGPHAGVEGITVSAEGGSSDVTDDSGHFSVEVSSKDGRVRLRFRRGDLDARLEISGLPAGSVLQVEVSLDGESVLLISTSDSRDDDFEGMATLVAVEGEAPLRTARVELTREWGSMLVDIVEGATTFDNEGDILSFSDMLAALDRADLAVKIEGDGELQDDGSVTATHVKVETDDDHGHDDDDDHDDDGHDEDFEGMAALVSVEGEAPLRTARVELTHESGSVLVDVVEGATTFDNEGDILSFSDMLAALDRADLAVKIEGDGELQDDGSFIATHVKVETDDDHGYDDDGHDDDGHDEDFEGMAALVSVTGDEGQRIARVELTNAAGSVLVDVVEGATLFDNEGDVLTFADMLAALARADLAVKIEGEGELQEDGSVTATKVKVETDES